MIVRVYIIKDRYICNTEHFAECRQPFASPPLVVRNDGQLATFKAMY